MGINTLAFSIHLELLSESAKFRQYTWNLCGDFMIIGLLVVRQADFMKYYCFLCLWDSRTCVQALQAEGIESRSTFVPDVNSVKENPLIDMNKVLLPPFQVQHNIMKNFAKALDKNGATFQHLYTLFPVSVLQCSRRASPSNLSFEKC